MYWAWCQKFTVNKNLIVRDWVAEFESYGMEIRWSKSLLMHILKRNFKK